MHRAGPPPLLKVALAARLHGASLVSVQAQGLSAYKEGIDEAKAAAINKSPYKGNSDPRYRVSQAANMPAGVHVYHC